jgi:chaperone modulatory protein CbpM
MRATAPDPMSFHAHDLVDEEELAHMCSMSRVELEELVDYGALAPMEHGPATQHLFSAACVPLLRKASRLRMDFDLDLFTVGLLLGYLQRVEELEKEVRSLRARLPHPLQRHGEGPATWREPHDHS